MIMWTHFFFTKKQKTKKKKKKKQKKPTKKNKKQRECDWMCYFSNTCWLVFFLNIFLDLKEFCQYNGRWGFLD
jgi:hypothetical protein